MLRDALQELHRDAPGVTRYGTDELARVGINTAESLTISLLGNKNYVVVENKVPVKQGIDSTFYILSGDGGRLLQVTEMHVPSVEEAEMYERSEAIAADLERRISESPFEINEDGQKRLAEYQAVVKIVSDRYATALLREDQDAIQISKMELSLLQDKVDSAYRSIFSKFPEAERAYLIKQLKELTKLEAAKAEAQITRIKSTAKRMMSLYMSLAEGSSDAQTLYESQAWNLLKMLDKLSEIS